MKYAASILAMDVWMTIGEEQNGGRSKFAARIRSAIRRAVKAERERCCGIIRESDNPGQVGPYERRYMLEVIVEKINTPATKRPIRKRK
jgi:hypothetical protein